jgi:hypothetical protein
MSDPAPAAAVPRSAGLAFGGWFLGFFLVAVGWAILVPFNHYPDEQHHVYRAAALVRGDLTPHIGPYMLGTGGILPVPQSLHAVYTPDACTGFATASQCEATADPDTVIMVSGQARVNPLYYAVVGLPTLLWPDANGILAMRVLSGALAAALLAAAVTVVLSLPGRRVVLLAALFAGLTPLALNLTGSISPSATELASADQHRVLPGALHAAARGGDRGLGGGRTSGRTGAPAEDRRRGLGVAGALRRRPGGGRDRRGAGVRPVHPAADPGQRTDRADHGIRRARGTDRHGRPVPAGTVRYGLTDHQGSM